MEKNLDKADLIADVREQVLYLQELGVEAFDVDLPQISGQKIENGKLKTESAFVDRPSSLSMPEINFKSEISNQKDKRPAGSRLASLPSLSSLTKRPVAIASEDLGNPDKVQPIERALPTFTEIKDNAEQFKSLIPIDDTAQSVELPTKNEESIIAIRAEIGPDCTRCKLCEGRTQVVNSTGNFNAELMFVGEAPGADEDAQGFPFVGRAGKLLTDIMGAIGFSREDVFIGNINRCRPPGNRAPEPDETIACKPFLKREIAVVRPKVIVVLGATAAHNLLETKVPIGKLRGHFHDYLGTKVMPTFHPAYLLRDPHKKREVWEDMKIVRDYLNAGK